MDRGAPPYSLATVESYLTTINLFVGFLHRFMGIQQRHWSLLLFTNQFFITAYVGFKIQVTPVRACGWRCEHTCDAFAGDDALYQCCIC